MPSTDPHELLRAGLLDGVRVLLARGAEGPGLAPPAFADAVHASCTALGAHVFDCLPAPPGAPGGVSEEELDGEVDRVLGEGGAIDLAVIDAAGLYAAGAAEAGGAGILPAPGGGAREALGTCLACSWNVTRAVANRAFLARQQGGRIVLVAPAPGAGEHADAARAGLENLARTLSIEWARHRITAVAVAPGDATAAGEVGELAAYLASPAGAYFSGCLLDLRGAAPAAGALAG